MTRSGIPVRVAVYRTEPPSDYVVPPAIYGVSLAGNVWYDCGNPALASNETLGTWTSVTDFSMVGTSFCVTIRVEHW